MDQELKEHHLRLGINEEHLRLNRLPFCKQAELSELEVVDLDHAGRTFVLARAAIPSWRAMCEAATSEQVLLRPASGFRSYLYQVKLIEGQLAKGRTIEAILTGQAIPGFSEHHTGRAVDIIADPAIPESEFHETETFRWMLANATRFGFRLSYPRDNPQGLIFEPWHWFFEG